MDAVLHLVQVDAARVPAGVDPHEVVVVLRGHAALPVEADVRPGVVVRIPARVVPRDGDSEGDVRGLEHLRLEDRHAAEVVLELLAVAHGMEGLGVVPGILEVGLDLPARGIGSQEVDEVRHLV